MKEYQTVVNISGPLLIAKKIQGAKYDEVVDIELRSGEVRTGKILEVHEDKILVQVFEGTQGLEIKSTKLRLKGRGLELGLSPDILGRVFSGLGKPIDKGPQIIPQKKIDINGDPINPVARDYPNDLFKQVFLLLTD